MSRYIRTHLAVVPLVVCAMQLAACSHEPAASSETTVADGAADAIVDAATDGSPDVSDTGLPDRADGADNEAAAEAGLDVSAVDPDAADVAQEAQDAAFEQDVQQEKDPNARLFSFAILTDIHIGEGLADYGTPGYDDSGGDEYDLTVAIRDAVKKVNDQSSPYDIRFVAVLGDMTDSGERSELKRSREILDLLERPYLPLLGNHDVWPYSANEEAATPFSDVWFEQEFLAQFNKLATELPGFVRAPTPTDNPEHGIKSTFINFAFDYEGYHFIALDLVTRSHAWLGQKGVLPEADLHDFPGGSWPWFTQRMASLQGLSHHNVVVFTHHPPMVNSLGIDVLSLGEDGKIGDFIQSGGYSDSLFGFFSGHTHVDLTLTRYQDQKVVISPSTKDNAAVRIVQVYPGGKLDWGTIL